MRFTIHFRHQVAMLQFDVNATSALEAEQIAMAYLRNLVAKPRDWVITGTTEHRD